MRRRLFCLNACVLLIVLLIARLGELAQAQSLAQSVIARVTLNTRAEVEQFIALNLDMLEMREGDDLFALTTISDVQSLRAQGWLIRVDEAQTALLNRLHLDTFSNGYRTVSEMRDFVNGEAVQYPNLTQVFTYGLSWEGRELFGIRLTNKQSNQPKPTFFLMAAIHARELSTSELALRFIDYLLRNYGVDGDATWLLDEQQVVVVPVANPDGRLLAEQGFYQRKNVDTSNGTSGCASPPTTAYQNQYGVDLNRNSSFKWGTAGSSTAPCDQVYRGPSASSEPETIALQNLIRATFPDQRGPNDDDAAPLTTTGILLTLHSFGNLDLYPWGYTNTAAPNANALALIAQKFRAYNGYVAEQSINLYPTSGTTDDWAYGDLGIPAFTFEVGPGSPSPCAGFMPPFDCMDNEPSGMFWPRNLPAFLHAARIARAPYQLALGPTVETTSVSASMNLLALISATQTISAAEYYVDTPPWRGGSAYGMWPADGAFDSASEVVSATLALTGRHLVFVRAQDVNGNCGPIHALWITGTTGLTSAASTLASSGGATLVCRDTLTVKQWLPWVAR